MIIGVPTEVKAFESRVGVSPAGAAELVSAGHELRVERGAGLGAGFADEAYEASGARLVSRDDAWAAELVIKVKEPVEAEYGYLRPGLTLFTYLHLAAAPGLAKTLLDRGVRAIAYETLQRADGSLPALRPMSEVAGRMAVQVGAVCLERSRGGKGLLLAGVPGTRRGRVVILGAGVVGENAARLAVGMGAEVTVLELEHARMARLEELFEGRIETLYSNPHNIAEQVRKADLVIGAVLVPGARAPVLVDRALIASMEPGSVVVDVAVDQGGCIETCTPTTHDDPTYLVDGVVHYCVANMPGAVSHTSSIALTNVTLRYARMLADKGVVEAVRGSEELARGVNCWDGRCVHEAVARAVGVSYEPLAALLPAPTAAMVAGP